MKEITVSARNLDDAITEALIELGITSDQLEYDVIEKGSEGFLGIGRKQAVIKARKKNVPESAKEIGFEDIKTDFSSVTEKFGASTVLKTEKKQEKKAEKKPEIKENKDNKEPKEVKETKEIKENKEAKEVKKDNKKEGKKDFRKESGKENRRENHRDNRKEYKKIKKEEPVQSVKKEEVALAEILPETKAAVLEFLQNVFKAMELEVQIVTETDEEGALVVELKGDNMGVLIGKRGQTLDSLQYLANRVGNKYQEGFIRIKLDTENYRKRREETLENLAKNIASKVKRTRRPVSLEPMNPYERRIIHSALQADRYVSTHSEGEEPYRRVVITPNKR